MKMQKNYFLMTLIILYIPTHLEEVQNPGLSFKIYIVKFIQSIMSDRQFMVREVTRHDQCKD